MPSVPVRIVGFLLGTTGIIRRRFTGGKHFLKNIRRAQSSPRPEPTAKMVRKFAVKKTDFADYPVWTMAPKTGSAAVRILFWHGGGYVYPISALHWNFLAHMVEKYRWSVTVPFYPLAPVSNAERTIDWAHNFYRDYLGSSGDDFVMAGDSAGAGLTAALTMRARAEGLTLPTKLLLLCPWLDLDPSNPEQAAIEPRDVILTRSGIRDAGKLYADNLRVDDPRCSPIYGEWNGLPQILAFGGGNDILVTDARALKAKHAATEYVELSGMMHDWPIFSFSESRTAQKRMAEFAGQSIP